MDQKATQYWQFYHLPYKTRLTGCRIDCMAFNIFSSSFKFYPGDQYTYPCFSGVSFTGTPLNILYNLLTAFSNKKSMSNYSLSIPPAKCDENLPCYHVLSEDKLSCQTESR